MSGVRNDQRVVACVCTRCVCLTACVLGVPGGARCVGVRRVCAARPNPVLSRVHVRDRGVFSDEAFFGAVAGFRCVRRVRVRQLRRTCGVLELPWPREHNRSLGRCLLARPTDPSRNTDQGVHHTRESLGVETRGRNESERERAASRGAVQHRQVGRVAL